MTTVTLDPELIEAAKVRMAQERFDYFCRYVEIPGAPTDEQDSEDDDFEGRRLSGPLVTHHQLLADKLQAVESGEIKRLMIFMPPGSAKSTYGSVLFPAWFMGRKRRRNVICATYGSDFAMKIGRRTRGVIKQPHYAKVFGMTVSAESAAADNWIIENGNEYMAGGIQSGITGNRADLIVVDDPVKNRAEADSETTRNKIWEEWEASIKTRAKPQCRYVIIQTRWHADDLSGRLLPEDWNGESGQILCRDGQYWEVICLQAEATRPDDPLGRPKGEMIWKEWFDDDHWISARTNLRNWYALYQQIPSGEEGLEFKREWFELYDVKDRPQHLNVYMTSDHAPSGNGDYNVFRIWGVDPQRNLWLLDSFRDKCKMIEAFGVESNGSGGIKMKPQGAFALIKKWKPLKWFPERDHSFISNEDTIKMWMRDLSVRTIIDSQPTRVAGAHGKTGKAEPYIELCKQGMVHIFDTNEGHDTIDEYISFPTGKHDDRVDADGMIARVLADVRKATVPEAPPKKAPDKYRAIPTTHQHSQRGFF